VNGPEDREGPPDPHATAAPFRAAEPDPLLQRAIPVAKEQPNYRPPTARRDLLAGVTVAALAIPSAMAYAELAGLPAVAGLYALLLPTVAYAFLGSSRQLIVGPEGSLSALVAAAVLALATAGSPEALELAGAMALLVAACFVIARVLGWAGWPTTSPDPCSWATSTVSPSCSSSASSASSPGSTSTRPTRYRSSSRWLARSAT
jgi:hypothetical protein